MPKAMSRNDNGSHTAVVTLLGRNGADKSGRNEGPKSGPLQHPFEQPQHLDGHA